MKFEAVTIVRIYISEGDHLLNQVITYLKNEAKVQGVSVFRAISGFGESETHTSFLIDLALDLPLSIEFFDKPDKIKKTIEHLNSIVKPKHIVCWSAEMNIN